MCPIYLNILMNFATIYLFFRRNSVRVVQAVSEVILKSARFRLNFNTRNGLCVCICFV